MREASACNCDKHRCACSRNHVCIYLNIYWAIAIIGLTTFVLSIIGVIVGNFFGNKYKKKSEIAGGIILILIGVKILLEHLGIISF